jgi:hypothetical protein
MWSSPSKWAGEPCGTIFGGGLAHVPSNVPGVWGTFGKSQAKNKNISTACLCVCEAANDSSIPSNYYLLAIWKAVQARFVSNCFKQIPTMFVYSKIKYCTPLVKDSLATISSECGY